MTVFDLGDLLTPLIEAVMFFLLFEAFLKRRDPVPLWGYGVGVLALAGMIAVSNHFLLYRFANVIGITVSAFIISWLYQGAWWQRILTAVFGSLIIGVTEIVVLFLITILFSIDVKEAITIAEYRFLGIIVSKILGLAVCNVIRLRHKAKHFQENRAYWLLFVLLFASSLVAVFLIFKLTHEIGTTDYNGMAGFAAFGLFFGTFFALYLYERLAQQSAALRMQEQYQRALRAQLKHQAELRLQQEALKAFKHDITNQLLVLDGYFACGDSAGGRRFLRTLLGSVEAAAPSVDTGNIALDAILSTKQAMAERLGIAFDLRVQIAEQLAVDPVDLGIIFSNALDNAIEACVRLDHGERRIRFQLVQQGEMLVCQIANTAPSPQDDRLTTSKPDKENHGYGFANLTTALAKYGGTPEVVWEDGWFTLSFVLFLDE